MLLMIDNYDSFTYNLVQYFGELGADVRVHIATTRSRSKRSKNLRRKKSSFRQAHVRPPKPASRWQRSSTLPASCRFSAYALGIKASVQRSAARSFVRRNSCTARHRRSSIRTSAFSRPAAAFHRDALPLAGDRARKPARLPRDHRLDGRRRDHGRAPQDPCDRRRAVPPGVHPHRGRASHVEEFPGGLR